MKKSLVIAGLTFQEAVRRRIVLAGLVLTCVFLAIYFTGVHFAFESIQSVSEAGTRSTAVSGAIHQFEAALFLSLGLFAASMIGALIAVFASGGTIAAEIEQATLHTIVTRPISRAQIILGKWLGSASLITIYMAALYTALIMIVYTQSGWMPENVVFAGALLVGGALVVLTAALFGSTFLPATANAIIVLLLFMTALIGGIIEQIGVMLGRGALVSIGIVSGLIMPTDSLYRFAVHLLKPSLSGLAGRIPPGMADMGPFGAASTPSGWVPVYALAFSIILLLASIRVFSRRDL